MGRPLPGVVKAARAPARGGRPVQEASEESIRLHNQQASSFLHFHLPNGAGKRCPPPHGHLESSPPEETLRPRAWASPAPPARQVDRPRGHASACAHLPHGRVERAPDGGQDPAGRVPRGLLQAGVPAETLSADVLGAQEAPQTGQQREAHGGHPGRGHCGCGCRSGKF